MTLVLFITLSSIRTISSNCAPREERAWKMSQRVFTGKFDPRLRTNLGNKTGVEPSPPVARRMELACNCQNSCGSLARCFLTLLLCWTVGGPRTSTLTPGSTFSRPDLAPQYTYEFFFPIVIRF